MRKSRWPSWAPVPNKPTVSVDVKLHYHRQNDFCITMGSDEKDFNVSLMKLRGAKSQDGVHKQPF